LGSRRGYEVDFSQTVILAANKDSAADGGAGENTALIKGLHATWSIVLVASTGSTLRYRAALSEVKAEANGQPYPAGDQLSDFSRPFFFETDSEGTVLSVAFDKACGTDARRTIKALVAASQVAVRLEGPDSWTTHEQDPTGEYEARYSRQGDPRHLSKERTQYLRIATESGLRPAADQGELSVRDTTTVGLLVNGTVDRIASQTETDMQFGKGMPRVHLTSVLATTLRKTDVDASNLTAMNRDWLQKERVDMASPPMQDDPKAKAEARRLADEKTVQHATLADLERELASIPRTSPRERAVLMSKLQADFRLHPDDTQKAVSYVRTAAVPDGQAIAGALGGAGTPEAMKALVDIAKTTDTPMPVRANAIGALAISTTPSPASVQALKGMTRDADPDISAASALALGAAAATARGTDPAGYQDAIDVLLADLNAARTPQAIVLYLRALGNSGDPRVLVAAQRYMGNEDLSVRAAAVAAVRFVQGAATDQFLAAAMNGDEADSVRVQAVATVEGYRAIADFVATFGQLLHTDASPLVRRAILHALNVIITNPTAMALITAAARTDAAENVRQYAQAILDAASTVAQR
jgi:hypothetical protein